MTQPVKTQHHVARVAKLSPRDIKHAMSQVSGFNAKAAVLITRGVGTMACAYLFTLLALVGLAPALAPGGSGIVPWIAQTFLQLVLLSIIMVGQRVQSAVSDARSEQTFRDAEAIMDRLDERTAGGIKTVLDRDDMIVQHLKALSDKIAKD